MTHVRLHLHLLQMGNIAGNVGNLPARRGSNFKGCQTQTLFTRLWPTDRNLDRRDIVVNLSRICKLALQVILRLSRGDDCRSNIAFLPRTWAPYPVYASLGQAPGHAQPIGPSALAHNLQSAPVVKLTNYPGPHVPTVAYPQSLSRPSLPTWEELGILPTDTSDDLNRRLGFTDPSPQLTPQPNDLRAICDSTRMSYPVDNLPGSEGKGRVRRNVSIAPDSAWGSMGYSYPHVDGNYLPITEQSPPLLSQATTDTAASSPSLGTPQNEDNWSSRYDIKNAITACRLWIY